MAKIKKTTSKLILTTMMAVMLSVGIAPAFTAQEITVYTVFAEEETDTENNVSFVLKDVYELRSEANELDDVGNTQEAASLRWEASQLLFARFVIPLIAIAFIVASGIGIYRYSHWGEEKKQKKQESENRREI